MDRWARAARLMEQYIETSSSTFGLHEERFDGHEVRYHLLELCKECLWYAHEIGLTPTHDAMSWIHMVKFGRMYIHTTEIIEDCTDLLFIVIRALWHIGTINDDETEILVWFYDTFNRFGGWDGPSWTKNHWALIKYPLTPLVGNSSSTPASPELGDAPSSPPPPDTQDTQA